MNLNFRMNWEGQCLDKVSVCKKNLPFVFCTRKEELKEVTLCTLCMIRFENIVYLCIAYLCKLNYPCLYFIAYFLTLYFLYQILNSRIMIDI